MRSRQSGFTLIEIMVVVVILAVLIVLNYVGLGGYSVPLRR